MKLEGVIKTLKSDIRDKQGELHRLRSGPDILQHKEFKPTEYEPPMSCAKSLEYLERERSPGYLERRDNDDYSLESSESDRDENKKDKEPPNEHPDIDLEKNQTDPEGTPLRLKNNSDSKVKKLKSCHTKIESKRPS